MLSLIDRVGKHQCWWRHRKFNKVKKQTLNRESSTCSAKECKRVFILRFYVLWRIVDRKHSMCFQSETSAMKFLQCSLDVVLVIAGWSSCGRSDYYQNNSIFWYGLLHFFYRQFLKVYGVNKLQYCVYILNSSKKVYYAESLCKSLENLTAIGAKSSIFNFSVKLRFYNSSRQLPAI